MADRSRTQSAVRTLEARTTHLWLLAVVFFVIGDVATTVVGLSGGQLVEVGPLASRFVAQFDVGALFGLKLAGVAACLGLWWLTPKPGAALVPFGVAVYGLLITAWNAALVFLHF